MAESIVFDKSKKFALRIINAYKYLCDEKKEFVLSKQLLRCGTSIGANIAEAECAISHKDFLAKMYISFKECNETKYWLELLWLSGYLSKEEYVSLYAYAEELYKLLSSVTKTMKKEIEDGNR